MNLIEKMAAAMVEEAQIDPDYAIRLATVAEEARGDTGEVERLRDKVKYGEDIGLELGMMKSSDKPEPYLCHDYREGSELGRLMEALGDNICLKHDLKTATQLAADRLEEITALKRRAGELEKVLEAVEWVPQSYNGTTRLICAWCKQELRVEWFRPGRTVCRHCNTKRAVACRRGRRALPPLEADASMVAAKLPFGRIGQ